MPEIASLSVAVTGDTSNLEQALGRANQSVSTFGGAFQNILGGIGAGIGIKIFDTLAAGMKAAGEAAIGFNAKLEQSTIAFTSMLGSGEKAQAFLDEMKAFAATTPFEFNDLLDASRKMLAFGFSAKDVKPLLESVGNAASAMGAGQSGIDRITNALGQMKAATVVQKGELNQLTEVGVPAYDILAKAVGKTTQEVGKMVEQGKISSDVFIAAFQEWAKANFGDMMAKQALTFDGAMSTIKDSLQFATAEALKPFFDAISAGAVQLAQFVQSDTFAAWAQGLAATLQEAFRQIADAWRTVIQVFTTGWEPSAAIDPFVNAVGQIALAIRDTVMPAVSQFIAIVQQAITAVGGATPIIAGLAAAFGAMVAIGATVAVIGAVTAAIAGLATPIGVVVTAIGVLTAAWVGNWGGIQGIVASAWSAMQPTFQQLADWLGSRIPPLLEWIANTGWPAVVQAGQAVDGMIGQMIGTVSLLAEQWGPLLQPVISWISDTGWPALVSAGEEVQRIVGLIITNVQNLLAELERRGVFDEVSQIWDNLVVIGGQLWGAIKNIAAVVVGLIALLADLARRGLESGRAFDVFLGPIQRMTEGLRTATDAVRRLIDWLNNLGRVRVNLPSFGGLNISGRALGGPVTAGMPYIVGERRPELFVPETSGHILPSVPSMAGGGGPVINVTLNVYGSVMNTKREIADFVLDGLRAAQSDSRLRMRVV